MALTAPIPVSRKQELSSGVNPKINVPEPIPAKAIVTGEVKRTAKILSDLAVNDVVFQPGSNAPEHWQEPLLTIIAGEKMLVSLIQSDPQSRPVSGVITEYESLPGHTPRIRVKTGPNTVVDVAAVTIQAIRVSRTDEPVETLAKLVLTGRNVGLRLELSMK